MIKIFKALNYVMAFLFVFAAVMQYNDPDGLLWMIIYGLAAAVCVLWLRGKINKIVAVTLAAISLMWSVWIFPDFTGQEAFNSFSMQSIEVEEMRESLGLLIIAIWMLVLAFIPYKEKKEKVTPAFKEDTGI